jgi:hypothetical protein
VVQDLAVAAADADACRWSPPLAGDDAAAAAAAWRMQDPLSVAATSAAAERASIERRRRVGGGGGCGGGEVAGARERHRAKPELNNCKMTHNGHSLFERQK